MLGFNLNDLLYWTIWWGSLGGNLLLMLCLYWKRAYFPQSTFCQSTSEYEMNSTSRKKGIIRWCPYMSKMALNPFCDKTLQITTKKITWLHTQYQDKTFMIIMQFSKTEKKKKRILKTDFIRPLDPVSERAAINHRTVINPSSMAIRVLKPQDIQEIQEFFFLIFRKCRKSSENTIRSSCNCFEWHIVMQYCPVANYHYVHNLWESVRGPDSEHFYVLVIFWKWKHFGVNC